MRRFILTLGVIALVSAGPASADETQTTIAPTQMAIPQLEPVVLGHVVSTTSHSVAVNTPDGERMMFEIDSRSMMPTTLGEGTPVKVEFRLMPNGMHHAQRITPLATGSKDLERLEALRAAAVESDRDAQGRWGSEETYARYEPPTGTTETTASDAGHTNGTDGDRVAADRDDGRTDGRSDDMAARTDTDGDGRNDALPQTASELPWLAAFGVTALAVAGALHLRRRRSA